MEAVLATLAVAALMLVALVLLAASWPRSSRLGGYRSWRGGRESDARSDDTVGGTREDDDAWRWRPDREDSATRLRRRR